MQREWVLFSSWNVGAGALHATARCLYPSQAGRCKPSSLRLINQSQNKHLSFQPFVKPIAVSGPDVMLKGIRNKLSRFVTLCLGNNQEDSSSIALVSCDKIEFHSVARKHVCSKSGSEEKHFTTSTMLTWCFEIQVKGSTSPDLRQETLSWVFPVVTKSVVPIVRE